MECYNLAKLLGVMKQSSSVDGLYSRRVGLELTLTSDHFFGGGSDQWLSSATWLVATYSWTLRTVVWLMGALSKTMLQTY